MLSPRTELGQIVTPRMILEREIAILKLIDHPNVTGLIDVHERDGTL